MNTWLVERPVAEIRPGDHAWLPFATGEERDHIIGAFVRDGLTTREKVVCIADTSPRCLPGPHGRLHADHRPAVRTGQLRLIPLRRACFSGGRFDPGRMLATFEQEISAAADEGYRAVRLTTDLSRTLTEPDGSRLLLDCEHRLATALAAGTMAMAICQIDRNHCAPDQFTALTDTHEIIVAPNPEFDDGVLTITRTFSPRGLRLAGEVDGARHAVFAEALLSMTASIGVVHLDFAGVRFIDLGALSLLAAYGMRLPHGRRLVLDNLPPDVEAVIEIVGWHRLPGITRGRAAP